MLKSIHNSFFLLRSTLWYPCRLTGSVIIVITLLQADFILHLSNIQRRYAISVLLFDIVLYLGICGSTARIIKLFNSYIYLEICPSTLLSPKRTTVSTCFEIGNITNSNHFYSHDLPKEFSSISLPWSRMIV